MSKNRNMLAAGPWDSWVPGVLSWQQAELLIEEGYIEAANTKYLDNSSLDLTLSDEAYVMNAGSVKPLGHRYVAQLKKEGLISPLKPDINGHFNLSVQKTYLFRLRESIANLSGSGLFGQATAKSSIGRMDVLARLIVDGMDVYESFDHSMLKTGKMYVELTPMTFNVLVKVAIPLVQLRFFRGLPRNCAMDGPELFQSVLPDASTSDGSLSVDLEQVTIAGQSVCAFRALRMAKDNPPLPLWKEQGQDGSDPTTYWHFEKANKYRRLTIRQNAFYIMRSKERIRLPHGIAVYCRATDETIGEMRIHYAGFVHPYFGERHDEVGTPLIFEIRGHDVDVTLSDKEKMARLEFFRMSEDCDDRHKDKKKDYNEQTLKLSGLFRDWPRVVELDGEGRATSNAG